MRLVLISLSLLCVAACTGGEVRGVLGVNKSAPDEFKVVSRPPLSVPPNFHLRPPEPGAPARVEHSTEAKAEMLLMGRPLMELNLDPFASGEPTVPTALDPTTVSDLADPMALDSADSQAEEEFLSNIGAQDADKNIRELIYEDNIAQPTVTESASPIEEWLGIAETESVIDPKAEAERIRNNKDEGKPVNEGEVETIDSGKKSVLESLFD